MDYILGIVVSLVVEIVKKIWKTPTLWTYLALLAASLIGAGLYVYFSTTDYWQTLVSVIVTASAFHNLIIRRLGTNQ